MSSKIGLRLALAAGLVGAAMSAQAWIITVAGTNVGGSLTVNYTYSTLIGNTFSSTLGGSLTSGSWSFDNGAGQSIAIAYTGTFVQDPGGTVSLDGTWTETSGTGIHVAPTGTYSASIGSIAGGPSDWEWSVVGSVPEPSQYAVLGIGLVGLLVRRRKSR